VLASVVLSRTSGRLGTPLLLLFLGIGMLAGSDGIGGIDFDNAVIAQAVGIAALTLILFSGGLDSKWKNVKEVFLPGISLSTFGILITTILTGFFIKTVTQFSVAESFLVGAIISSTDAAAVFTILRSNKVSLKPSLKHLLEFESGSNDPMAVFLTISLIHFIQAPQSTLHGFIISFFIQMSVGAAAGYLLGKLSVFTVNRVKLEFEGLYPVLTLSLVFLTYGLTSSLGGNGFLAVYAAGIVVGNSKLIHRESLIRFHDGLSWLMQITMFITLGLLVFPSRIPPVIVPGLLISIFLILIARPLAVFVSLLPSKLSIREKIFISWVGLRGAVPVILATFPMVALIKGSDQIFNLVFFIVITSSLFQGTSISLVTKLLKLDNYAGISDEDTLQLSPEECIKCRLLEIKIPAGSKIAGKEIIQAGFPGNTRVLLINKGSDLLNPNGNTIIKEGDVLLIAAEPADFLQIEEHIKPNTGISATPG
jgi:cell volume regulation protein A